MTLGLIDFDNGKSISRVYWKGWALKNNTFLKLTWQFGNNRRECHLRPKKSGFSGPTLCIGSRIGFALIKIIKSKRHVLCIKTGNFMYKSFYSLYCMVRVSCEWVLMRLCRYWYGYGGWGGRAPLPPPTHTALCTEQFRNQQRYVKCRRYASGT
jgi:hypothetical protein